MRAPLASAVLVLSLAVGPVLPVAAQEAEIEDYAFAFEGPFGSYDRNQLQRGLQVFTEVCSACHGLQYVSFRSLGQPGGPELPADQVRAYAANYEVWDPDLLDGEGDYRPAVPTDHFPKGAIANAPDLSVMAKARAAFHGPYGTGISQLVNGIGGPEYIHALLLGYTGDDIEQGGSILYENLVYPSGYLAMPQPLYGDDVTYEDGSPTDLLSVSADVAAFLMWTAEPKLDARKQAGFVGVLMLLVLAALLYFTNKRIWSPVKHREIDTPGE